MLIPEDGRLSVITRSGTAPFNNIMIIKLPEQYQKPTLLSHQFATLDPTKKTEKWPADKFLEDPASYLKEVIEEKNNEAKIDEDNSVLHRITPEASCTNENQRLSMYEPKNTSPITRQPMHDSINQEINAFNSQNPSPMSIPHNSNRHFPAPSNDIDVWLPPTAVPNNMGYPNMVIPNNHRPFETSNKKNPRPALLGDGPSSKNGLLFKQPLLAENNLDVRRPEIGGFNNNNHLMKFNNHSELNEHSKNLIVSPIQVGHPRGPMGCAQNNLYNDNLDPTIQLRQNTDVPFNNDFQEPQPRYNTGYNGDITREYPPNFGMHSSNFDNSTGANNDIFNQNIRRINRNDHQNNRNDHQNSRNDHQNGRNDHQNGRNDHQNGRIDHRSNRNDHRSNRNDHRSNRNDNFDRFNQPYQYPRNKFMEPYNSYDDRHDPNTISSYNRSHLPVNSNYDNSLLPTNGFDRNNLGVIPFKNDHQNVEVWETNQPPSYIEPFKKPEDISPRSKYLPRNPKRFWRGGNKSSGHHYQDFKRNKNNRGRGNYTSKNKKK